MRDNILYFERTASGRFREIKANRTKETMTNQPSEGLTFLDQIRIDWKQKNLQTETIDKLESLLTICRQPENRARFNQLFQKIKAFFMHDTTKGVVKKMTDTNLSNLMKKLLESGDTPELMNNVLKDPALSKQAMSMMKDMLQDEDKLKSMTDMMSSFLDKEVKSDEE
ncbi:hypothetical protein [Paraliobacillus sediminis]|uniref:hypothetical protein n=1 Tax=Paraliobacillus sediminis TaxID=1885916 RepID=UPI000E3C0E7A|nr:hypothetical protein [Paraliobacillus sediminis]